MAWIGSDGSEGKEGKEDGNQMASLKDRVLRTSTLPSRLPVTRTFIQVDLVGAKGLDPRQMASSNEYWQNARAFGLVEGSLQSPSGDTSLFLVVSSEDEAQRLVKSDPLVASGAFAEISYRAVKFD